MQHKSSSAGFHALQMIQVHLFLENEDDSERHRTSASKVLTVWRDLCVHAENSGLIDRPKNRTRGNTASRQVWTAGSSSDCRN
jgi:hypothetical protein